MQRQNLADREAELFGAMYEAQNVDGLPIVNAVAVRKAFGRHETLAFVETYRGCLNAEAPGHFADCEFFTHAT